MSQTRYSHLYSFKHTASGYLNFVVALNNKQAKIHWKVILIDVAETLRATQPVYSHEETLDAMVQIRVSFRLPLNSSGTKFKDIVVVGKQCSTVREAENEASAAALQVLQHGPLRICVTDVSRMRCRELEKTCYDILANSTELYNALKSVLSDWEDGMDKMEFCYASERRKLVESMGHTVFKTHGEISPDVADQLAMLTRENYLKMKELSSKIEEVKT
jgi:hypothetical protein